MFADKLFSLSLWNLMLVSVELLTNIPTVAAVLTVEAEKLNTASLKREWKQILLTQTGSYGGCFIVYSERLFDQILVSFFAKRKNRPKTPTCNEVLTWYDGKCGGFAAGGQLPFKQLLVCWRWRNGSAQAPAWVMTGCSAAGRDLLPSAPCVLTQSTIGTLSNVTQYSGRYHWDCALAVEIIMLWLIQIHNAIFKNSKVLF